VVVRFNLGFAHMEPRKFIENILVKQLGVKAVFVGKDFRFGKERLGDIALLQEHSAACGYEMHAVSQLKGAREIISSTRIRQLVRTGKLDQAARLLGRTVSVSGAVVKGASRGRSLGYPTANIAYEADIIPPQGVYVVKVLWDKKSYPAIANIGTRPSFEKQNSKLYLEVYILDFSGNIYGQHLQVEFLQKIRNEKKFSSPQSLIHQIQKDESLARKYFDM
jgi:riboflavin kinase/FMN adenylyltransferase